MSLSIRESIISIGSRMLQRHIEEDIHYDIMTIDELQEMQENLLQQIWMLTLENDIYERYLTRQDPHSLKVIKAILEREKITRRMTAHLIPRALSHVSFRESLFNLHDPGRLSPTVRSISGSRSPSITRFRTPSVVTLTEGAKIPIPHRIVMAKKEVEELKKKLELFQNYVRKRKMDLKAHIDEIEIRISEIQEAKEDFEVEVVTEGVDRLTGKIPAERLIR
ncbi:uncharacterized protein LOC100869422 isoform X1 [Apis florea]|uniref:uncharacterized protein LOC100869422 isoform X1 n=1 Tax=Apis florea TaxID=7463 RepID=UPI000252B286|nr:uncharacterized protein LOC100869422 isoform X1 [Apis florea]